MTADAFAKFSDAIEKGATPRAVASAALKEHWKVIFNGNGYDVKNHKMLTEAGVWRIDSGIEAICHLNSAKNVAMFSNMGVLTAAELNARKEVQLGQYITIVNIECSAMISMINQHVIPAIRKSDLDPNVIDSGAAIKHLCKSVSTLRDAMAAIAATHASGHGAGSDDLDAAKHGGLDSLDVSRHEVVTAADVEGKQFAAASTEMSKSAPRLPPRHDETGI
jgi:glutamine synthetase type III